MPPPAPRQSRANEDKTSSKDDRTKTMPQANRDKCGACKQNHDIRYCPYPNTDDGRTKICPICDTTKHAWCECWYYKRDVTQQFQVCYENRRCLPTLVHDESIRLVLVNKVTFSSEIKGDNGQEALNILNKRPGPLSPAFVKTLMPTQVTDPDIQIQLSEGRCAPWDLVPGDLLDRTKRTTKAFSDPSTAKMTMDTNIEDTWSSLDNIPHARKLDYFKELHKANQAREASFAQTAMMKPPTGPVLTVRSRRSAARKKLQSRIPDDPVEEMDTECVNCGSSDHGLMECPSPCKACGDKMAEHGIKLNGTECTAGCLCKPDAGHPRTDCTQLCRPCLVLKSDSNTAVKDCKEHCPVHITTDGLDHYTCTIMAKRCGACQGEHWYQDCTEFLGRICPLDCCRKVDCTAHRRKCGGSNVDGIAALFANNENTAYRRGVEELVSTWHQYLEIRQWDRVVTPDASMATGAWSALRCKIHKDIKVDVASLEQVRAARWSSVVDCVRGGFTEKTVARAKALLRVPECEACRRVTDTMISDLMAQLSL